jgi:hypothetical protein
MKAFLSIVFLTSSLFATSLTSKAQTVESILSELSTAGLVETFTESSFLGKSFAMFELDEDGKYSV